MIDRTQQPPRTTGTESRSPWVQPAYSRASAGDAELGPNPDDVDGAFTNS